MVSLCVSLALWLSCQDRFNPSSISLLIHLWINIKLAEEQYQKTCIIVGLESGVFRCPVSPLWPFMSFGYAQLHTNVYVAARYFVLSLIQKSWITFSTAQNETETITKVITKVVSLWLLWTLKQRSITIFNTNFEHHRTINYRSCDNQVMARNFRSVCEHFLFT